VVDQPNSAEQAHSSFAQNIVREILKEVLPYMNIYPDEELTGINADLTISGSEVLQEEPEAGGEDVAEPDNAAAEEPTPE
jgi:stage V sporulation protein D (sporulation-specific penicillin-binding protein)